MAQKQKFKPIDFINKDLPGSISAMQETNRFKSSPELDCLFYKICQNYQEKRRDERALVRAVYKEYFGGDDSRFYTCIYNSCTRRGDDEKQLKKLMLCGKCMCRVYQYIFLNIFNNLFLQVKW